MDLGINEAEFTHVLSMFGRAREEFDLIGNGFREVHAHCPGGCGSASSGASSIRSKSSAISRSRPGLPRLKRPLRALS